MINNNIYTDFRTAYKLVLITLLYYVSDLIEPKYHKTKH